MESIEQLRKQILSDGKIDHNDIRIIKEDIRENGTSLKLANMLFDIKDNVAASKLPKEFMDLFVNTIVSFLLDDEDTPGEIDEEEAKWLRGKIQKNSKLDEYDKAVLAALKERSINYPAILQYKSFRARQFERGLYSTRYLSLIAVVGSIISSVILFVQGLIVIITGLVNYFQDTGKHDRVEEVSTIPVLSYVAQHPEVMDILGADVVDQLNDNQKIHLADLKPKSKIVELAKADPNYFEFIGKQEKEVEREHDTHERTYKLFEQIVSSVDVFLFALVLIIFGVGVYELFVTQVDPVEQNLDSRPSWLKISSVDDLKSSLGKVILMVLIVSFFKHVLEFDDWKDPVALLYLSIGIILIAAALYLAHKSGGEEGKAAHATEEERSRFEKQKED